MTAARPCMVRQNRDLVAVAALTRFSYEFEESHPWLAAEAWSVAVDTAATYGLTPSQAVGMIRW